MNDKISIACLTSDLLGGSSFSINYNMMLIISGILENFDIQCIDIFTHNINDGSDCSFTEIQNDFEVFLPKDRIRIFKEDAVDYLNSADRVASYSVLFVQMYVWSEAVERAKQLNPDLKVISWIHSLLCQEYIANMQRKWIGYDNFLDMQKRLLDQADMVITDSQFDNVNAKRFHNNIIKKSKVIYPVSSIIPVKENFCDVSGIKETSSIKLLYSGRWEYRKGVEQLIECFFRCYTEFGMKLDILSDSNYLEDYENIFQSPSVKRKFESLCSCGAVRMIRWKRSRTEYIEYVKNNCDIAVIPSLYDPFNIIAYDCFCLGKPMVLSRFCGVEELISDECDSVVKVNPFDVDDLYSGILELSHRIINQSSIRVEKPDYLHKNMISDFVEVLSHLTK